MKVELRFDTRIVNEPAITSVALEKRVLLNILKAQVDEHGGRVLIEIPDEAADEVIEAFERRGVKTCRRTLIEVNERCMSCGHCITLCPVDALYRDELDQTVRVKADECIQCGRCVDACPMRAITLLR
ncbi:MAG: 4Fe-4S binding protein [Candidatus Bathyarchaeia archaeon]